MAIRNIVLSFCLGVLVVGCEHEPKSSPDIEFVTAPGAEDMNLPFSPAVRVDNTIYLSGNIGNIPGKMELVPGGIKGETRQTMENIKQVLEHLGSSMQRVVKCTIFLDDMSEYAVMNEEYAKFFPEAPPARSTLGADGLALGAAVEIECIALVGDSR